MADSLLKINDCTFQWSFQDAFKPIGHGTQTDCFSNVQQESESDWVGVWLIMKQSQIIHLVAHTNHSITCIIYKGK